MRRRYACLVVCLLLVTSGCYGGSTAEMPDDCTLHSLSIWYMVQPDDALPNEISYSFESVEERAIPADGAKVLFVAFVDGEALGEEYVTWDHPMAADGASIELEQKISGNHTVWVAAFDDENGNRTFDPGTDRRCTAGGEPIRTDKVTHDFPSPTTTTSS